MGKQQKQRVLSRDEILAKHKADVKTVEVPGWGGAVRVRPLPFPEIIRIKSQYPDESERGIAMAVASCVDLKPEDFKALREGNGITFSQLIGAIMGALNGDDLGN